MDSMRANRTTLTAACENESGWKPLLAMTTFFWEVGACE